VSRRYLVLHGWQNHRPPEHWEWLLVDALRARGEQVLYPQLPAPDHPVLDDWLDVFAGEWLQMGSGERVVVAHSLSCLLWLHAAERGLVDPPADRVLLVAPPSPAVTSSYAEMAGYLAPQDPASVWLSSRAPMRLVPRPTTRGAPRARPTRCTAARSAWTARSCPGPGTSRSRTASGPGRRC
jgi:hypothetical protein